MADEVRTAGGFQSSVPPEVHFGLGGLASEGAELAVRWPDGEETVHPVEGFDRTVVIERAASGTDAGDKEGGE